MPRYSKERGGWENPASATNGKSGGRPRKYFKVERDQHLVLERQTIGSVEGTFHKPELVKVLSVSADEIEMQVGNDIVVLRVPDANEVA